MGAQIAYLAGRALQKVAMKIVTAIPAGLPLATAPAMSISRDYSGPRLSAMATSTSLTTWSSSACV